MSSLIQLLSFSKITILLSILKKNRAPIIKMAVLYAGKTSGLAVSFFFLPLYSQLLGAEQFGVVAIILSLQALLMMLDLGISILVTRDIAAGELDSNAVFKLLHTSEINLSYFYLFLFILTLVIKSFGFWPDVKVITALFTIGLFWFLVLQNTYCSAMLARRCYIQTSILQAVGVIIRALLTAFVLVKISATLDAFILTQLAASAVYWAVTRYVFINLLDLNDASKYLTLKIPLLESMNVLKRGGPFVLFSAAGAAVTQLDKPLITVFMAASNVTPYFLATTLCMLPITILAAPVNQYFQPKILGDISLRNSVQTQNTIKKFLKLLFLITGIPCLILWFLRAPIVNLWMGNDFQNIAIINFVAILLPGCAVGALGYIPFNLLLAAKDSAFQAGLSVTMTTITLTATLIAAYLQSIESICYIYASYHSASTLLSWLRAIYLPSSRVIAKYSFFLAIKGVFLIFGIVLLTSSLLK